MKYLTRNLTMAVCAAFATGGALADAYPDKAVRIVVPFAAGGSSDNATRVLAEQLAKDWKQAVVVDNKPGANGSIGAAQVAKAPADGYTIYLAPVSIGTVNLFIKKPGFDVEKDLMPVTLVARGDYVLNVNKDVPVNTIAELADYSRKHPGKLFHGSFGGASWLAFEQLSETLNFNVTNVNYRGESPALTALMGGEIQVMFSTLTAARPFIEANKIKALGLTAKKRSTIAPNIKSADESGAKGFYVDFWFGLMVPAGTPPEIVKKINASTAAALNRPDVKGRLFGMGLNAAPSTPEEFGKVVKFESERWVSTAKRINLEPQ